MYRIPNHCQFQSAGSGPEHWGKGVAATSELSGKECHSRFLMSVRSSCAGHPLLIHCDSWGNLSFKMNGLEENQTWFWIRGIYLCRWRGRVSGQQLFLSVLHDAVHLNRLRKWRAWTNMAECTKSRQWDAGQALPPESFLSFIIFVFMGCCYFLCILLYLLSWSI